jgi:hypothetical protein
MLSRPRSAEAATQRREGEASGFSKRKSIFSPARFFASLRFAQNDKAINVFANKRLINNNVSK